MMKAKLRKILPSMPKKMKLSNVQGLGYACLDLGTMRT